MDHLHGGSFRLIADRDVTADMRQVVLLREPGTARQNSARFMAISDEADDLFELEPTDTDTFAQILRAASQSTMGRTMGGTVASGAQKLRVDAYTSVRIDIPDQPTLALNEIGLTDLVEIGQELTRPLVIGETGPGHGDTPAAYTYIGQFIAHDLSDMVVHLTGTANLRTTSLDLSSIFGHPVDLAQTFVGPTTPGNEKRDIARNPDGSANIKDGRNDANLAVAQVHNMVARFYLRERTQPGQTDDNARRATIDYFQKAVIDDYLPRIVGQDMVDTVLAGPRLLPTGSPFLIPMEFALACFRFGHAQVRDNYFHGFAPQSITPSDLIDFTHPGGVINDSGAPGTSEVLPASWHMDWSRMIGPGATLKARRIAARIANNHGEIKSVIAGDPQNEIGGTINLAAETLIRGQRLHLPTAQDLIAWIGTHRPDIGPLGEIDLADAGVFDDATRHATDKLKTILANGLAAATPLWLYTLLESQAATDGERLGPLAGRIVAETLIAAIEADPQGILSPTSTFQPLDLNGQPFVGKYEFINFVERAFSP